MRSVRLLAFSGLLLFLAPGSPAFAAPVLDDQPDSEEVTKLKAETGRLQAEADMLKAEADRWKAQYGLDFGSLGKSGAIDADKLSSVPWQELATNFQEDANKLYGLVGPKLGTGDILLAEKPMNELVIKRRFFDKFKQDVTDQLKKKPRDVEEGNKIFAIDGGMISVGVASLVGLLKLFHVDRSAVSTDFTTGIDEAFTYVLAQKLVETRVPVNAANGQMVSQHVFISGKTLPEPEVDEINAFKDSLKELEGLQESIGRELASDTREKEKDAKAEKDKGSQKDKKKTEASVSTLAAAAKTNRDERIRINTEKLKLLNDFYAAFNLNTTKGIEDLIQGAKLSRMPTLSVKVVKAFGDTMTEKRTFTSDKFYVSHAFSVQYAVFDAKGFLVKSGVYNSEASGKFHQVELKGK